MIRITYDERSEKIRIDIDPSSDDGRMSHRDLILHMVCIVVGMASFIRKAADENTMNRFFDAVRDAGFADMISMLVDDIEEKE